MMKTIVLIFTSVLLTGAAKAGFKHGELAYQYLDFERAYKEFLVSAGEGHAGAQFYLGEMYETGILVGQDPATAFEWYKKAALQGHAPAQTRLAASYQNGYGVKRDINKAFDWYLKAARNGNVIAQYKVGLLYSTKKVKTTDLVEAYKWLEIATSYGEPDAPAALSKLSTTMSKQQKKVAKARALSWEQQWEKSKTDSLDFLDEL